MTMQDLIDRELALCELVRRRVAAALAYAARGWRIVPLRGIYDGMCTCPKEAACDQAGKHPWLTGWPALASIDPAVIVSWWTGRRRLSNLAVVTGSSSGFFVLDIDPRNGGDESFARLTAQHGALPPTPVQQSGGGGRHYFFRQPTWRIPNRSGDTAVAPGVDIKGEHGLIVMAPSMHVSGREYCWDDELHPDRIPLAPAPGWLLRLILSRQPLRPSTGTPPGPLRTPSTEYARLLAGVPEGQRHATATRLAGHFLKCGIAPTEVEAILLGFALRCPPPMDTADIRRIVEDFTQKNGTAAYTISVKVR